jgi:adenine/guanine phosphoribosyltransferase-like PRPP-binding protein
MLRLIGFMKEFTGFSSVDREKIPPFELPIDVSGPVVEANKRIADRFKTQDSGNNPSPDFVFVLERSAVLPASSASLALRSKQVPVIELPVGKVLPLLYSEALGEEEEELDLTQEETATRFMGWFKTTQDPTILRLKDQLTLPLKKANKILVLDDAKSTGETLDQTLPLIMKALTSRPIALEQEAFYPANFHWEKAIIDQIEAFLTPAEKKVMTSILKGAIDLRRIKLELESGWYELSTEKRSQLLDLINFYYNRGFAILPVEVEGVVSMMGLQAMQEASWQDKNSYLSEADYQYDISNNPGDRLLDRFGFMNLQILRDQVKQQFASLPINFQS